VLATAGPRAGDHFSAFCAAAKSSALAL